jgi:hypothetical protein
MVVIVQQTIGMANPAKTGNYLTQHRQKLLAVTVIKKHRCIFHATCSDMAGCAREFDSYRSGHAATLGLPHRHVNTAHAT